MISWHDLYTVLAAVVPLYVAMNLAYGSVRWWKIFSPEQCSGINRFVAIFAVPLLSFHYISSNNPYQMNLRFIAADTLQKMIMLVVLALWTNLTRNGSLEWMITIFSLSTLPDTLMVQIVVLQCIIWYTLLLFLFEYGGAMILIMDQFPETAASIVSLKVDSDVVSFNGRDFLETDAEIGLDGKLHLVVRKSNVSRRSMSGMTPRPSNLTGAEIYSLSSSRNPTPRGSNFNTSDFYSMFGGRLPNFGPAETYTPRASNFDENPNLISNPTASPRFRFYPSSNGPNSVGGSNYPASNPELVSGKELQMFVWSSSASPVSEVGGLHVSGSADFGTSGQSGRSDHGAKEIRMMVSDDPQNGESKGMITPKRSEDFETPHFSLAGGEEEREKDGPVGQNKMGSSSTAELHLKKGGGKHMPPASVMTRLTLNMVWRKLIRNPKTGTWRLSVNPPRDSTDHTESLMVTGDVGTDSEGNINCVVNIGADQVLPPPPHDNMGFSTITGDVDAEELHDSFIINIGDNQEVLASEPNTSQNSPPPQDPFPFQTPLQNPFQTPTQNPLQTPPTFYSCVIRMARVAASTLYPVAGELERETAVYVDAGLPVPLTVRAKVCIGRVIQWGTKVFWGAILVWALTQLIGKLSGSSHPYEALQIYTCLKNRKN